MDGVVRRFPRRGRSRGLFRGWQGRREGRKEERSEIVRGIVDNMTEPSGAEPSRAERSEAERIRARGGCIDPPAARSRRRHPLLPHPTPPRHSQPQTTRSFRFDPPGSPFLSLPLSSSVSFSLAGTFRFASRSPSCFNNPPATSPLQRACRPCRSRRYIRTGLTRNHLSLPRSPSLSLSPSFHPPRNGHRRCW